MRWLYGITYSRVHEFEQALGVVDGQGNLIIQSLRDGHD